MIFMDDTTDNFTPNNDQGKVRVAKLFSGDIDNDGNGDVVFSSASFATDKPQLFMIEHEEEAVVVAVDDNNPNILANKPNIEQNYPNPFNPSTSFHYNLPKSGMIELTITDIIGREVITLVKGYQRSGNHNILWTGNDNMGNKVPSGIYFYNLKSESSIVTKKMTLSK